MRTLPTTMVQVLAPFVPLFSERVWAHVRLLLAGAILAPGKRTVASALRAVGLQQERRFCRYHRVLSRAAWSSREASRVLLGLLVETFVPQGPLVVGIDETLERRRGKKIAAKGIYRFLRYARVIPTSSRRALLGGYAWWCSRRFGGPLEFGPYLSCRRWLLPSAMQERPAKGTRVSPNGPSSFLCW
jgi:DDE superfamily endonuclease